MPNGNTVLVREMLPLGLRYEILDRPCELDALTFAYATKFWAGAWQELLKTPDGSKQYGTVDAEGTIYPETAELLGRYAMSPNEANWQQKLWEMACRGELVNTEGAILEPYWTLESARAELEKFIAPSSEGGFGGKILVIQNEEDEIIGFTAYCIAGAEKAVAVIDGRFPQPLADLQGSATEASAGDIVTTMYPDQTVGVFLDFAIAETARGNKLGSRLFDERIRRLVARGAEVLVGRTTSASPEQYYGNYIKRGMFPVALNRKDPKKAIFVVPVEDLVQRKRAVTLQSCED